MTEKQKILLIDQHPEWLSFAQAVLTKDYDVITFVQRDLLDIPDNIKDINGFDLIFLGLELATQNLDLLKPLFKQWRFVVIFPIIQENDTVRLLFKAGAYDCAPKPYESAGLLKLVAEELDFVESEANLFKKQAPKSHQETIEELASILNIGG